MSPFARAMLLAAASLGGAAPALAEENGLTLSGAMRLRYESLEGQARAGLRDSEELVSLRTILTADYHADDLLFRVELRDSRAFGVHPDAGISTNDVNTVELVQANVTADLGERFGTGTRTTVEAGRMTIRLGAGRLVVSDDYRNATTGYTGLRADHVLADGTSMTLLYVLPQIRLPEDIADLRSGKVQMDRENFDTQLWAATVTRPKLIGRMLGELTYVGLAERDSPDRATRDRRLHSFSARLFAEPAPRKVDFDMEAIYQTGTISASLLANAERLGVTAGFLHVDTGYTFPGAPHIRLSVEYDWASGDRPGGRYGRFDTIYGNRREEFAPSGLLSVVGRANISAPGVRVEVKPDKRFDAFAAWHPLYLASRTDAFSTSGVVDASGAAGSFAGHMVDMRARWWVVPKRLRAEFNATYIAKGRFLETAPNAPVGGDTRFVSMAMTTSF